MNISNTPIPSSKLKIMLEEVNQAFGAAKAAFGHAGETVRSAYFQSISEGFSPEGAKRLIFANVKNASNRTIYLHLPDEAKDKKMQALAKRPRSLQICSDDIESTGKSTRQLLREQKALVVNSSESTTELVTEKAIPESTIELEESEIDLNEAPGQEILSSLRTSGTILLEHEFSELIYQKVSLNKPKGKKLEFILTHDGEKVLSVENSKRL